MNSPRPPGRPRKGSLELRSTGYFARLTVDVDGLQIRKRVPLATDNLAVARAKLRRLLKAELKREAAADVETFQAAADRVLDVQERQGMATVGERRSRLTRYGYPALGPLSVTAIKAAHVRGTLEAARDAGLGRQSLTHLLHDVSSVLADLWRAELLPENVARRVTVKSVLPYRDVRKERAVMTDAELVRYLAWQHPDERFRMAVLERQVMACVARMLGGQRTSDLHAARWEDFEPDFTEARIRNVKTGKPRTLAVPAMLRPILADWHVRHGQPTEGPVFPVRRGKRLGEQRKRTTHARAFRRDLRRALGLDVWTGEAWEPGREPTQRERVLLDGDDQTLPVDFHSWRRAFSQALAEAGINEQQAMGLTGHESEEAHRRYLRNAERRFELPAAALPKLDVSATPWPKLEAPEIETSMFSSGRDRSRTCDIRLVRPAGREPSSTTNTVPVQSGRSEDTTKPQETAGWAKPLAKTPAWPDAVSETLWTPSVAESVLRFALHRLADRLASRFA